MAEHCIFGFNRWTEDAVFSGGSWNATYPVTNLGSLPLSRVARSSNATIAATQFVATLSQSRPIRLLALVRHNCSLTATFRVRLYGDTGLTELVYDSGWIDVWPACYSSENLEWEDDNWWTCGYTAEEVEGYPWTRPLWLGQVWLARAVKVEIDDTTNSDGYVQSGLCEIAQGWQPTNNFRYGLEHGLEDPSESQRALGGAEYFDERPLQRVVRGELPGLSHDEAMERGFELQRRSGRVRPFLWCPFPDSPEHWLRDTFLARHAELGLLGHVSHQRDRFPFSLREVVE